LKLTEYHAAPEIFKDRRLKRNYGIGLDFYEQLLGKQDGKCAICGEPENGRALAVDHDHGTGNIRGLLCTNCNNGLGRFRDDVSRLRNAIEYLKNS
jgi:hypothetical protein